MNEIDKVNNEIIKATPKLRFKDSSRVVITREIIAAILWLFLIIKVFIFDIDSYIISLINPKFVSILNYKFFILIALIAIVWGILGNKKFLKLISVIIFYPFIFLFWRVPVIFWKSKMVTVFSLEI